MRATSLRPGGVERDNVGAPVRNPFRKNSGEQGKPAATIIVDVDAARQRYLTRCPDHPMTPLEDAILFNAVIVEMGEEAEKNPDAQGNFVIFLVDEDGFVLSQEGEYLVPVEAREGNTFARLVGGSS
jgi:hypothetical protein